MCCSQDPLFQANCLHQRPTISIPSSAPRILLTSFRQTLAFSSSIQFWLTFSSHNTNWQKKLFPCKTLVSSQKINSANSTFKNMCGIAYLSIIMWVPSLGCLSYFNRKSVRQFSPSQPVLPLGCHLMMSICDQFRQNPEQGSFVTFSTFNIK